MKKDLNPTVAKELVADLGTENTVIYVKSKDLVLFEPTVLAVENENGQIIAVGKEANEMAERNPNNITIIKPLQNGVIADFDEATAMLKLFIKKAIGTNLGKNSIMMSYPAGSTQVEKMAAQDLAKHSISGQVTMMAQPIAVLIAEGISPTKPQARMIINIGAGFTEVSVCIFGEVLSSFKENIAGNEIDQNIVRYVKNKHKLLISNKSAKELKHQIGSAFFGQENQRFVDVKGRSIIDNLPKSISVNSDEIREVITSVLSVIPRLIIKTTEDLAPQVVADIMETELIVTGGTANLSGIKEYIENISGLSVKIADKPMQTIALGMSKC